MTESRRTFAASLAAATLGTVSGCLAGLDLGGADDDTSDGGDADADADDWPSAFE